MHSLRVGTFEAVPERYCITATGGPGSSLHSSLSVSDSQSTLINTGLVLRRSSPFVSIWGDRLMATDYRAQIAILTACT